MNWVKINKRIAWLDYETENITERSVISQNMAYSVESVYLHCMPPQVAVKNCTSFPMGVTVTIVDSVLSFIIVKIVITRSRPILFKIVISPSIIVVMFRRSGVLPSWTLVPAIRYKPPFWLISTARIIIAGSRRIIIFGRIPIFDIVRIVWIISITRIVVLGSLLKHLVIPGLFFLFVNFHIIWIHILHVCIIHMVDGIACWSLLAHWSENSIFGVFEIIVGICISRNVWVVGVWLVGYIFPLLEIQLPLTLFLPSLLLDIS